MNTPEPHLWYAGAGRMKRPELIIAPVAIENTSRNPNSFLRVSVISDYYTIYLVKRKNFLPCSIKIDNITFIMETKEAGSLEKLGVGEIMRKAYSEHIVIPAFNVPYLPMIEPIVETLKALGCFGMVEVARPDVEKFEAGSFKKAAEGFNRCADRNFVRLHQDHIPVIDEDWKKVDWETLIREALDIGYDSVMIDGSRLSLEENIKVTKAVVDMSHAGDVPVEAELGAVLGHEKGPLPPYEELFSSGKGFTDVDEARRFVEETGVDWLSVAVGNIHGAIDATPDKKKVEARINIDHLRRLSETVGIPLVLHGGSGIKQESVLSAIQNGITKINVGTALRQAYERKLTQGGDVSSARDAVAREVEFLIKDYYHIQGSAAKL